VFLIAGARPNFVKVAPLFRALRRHPGLEVFLVHTGQHYDDEMSAAFLHDLELPSPDIELRVGSASHAVQTSRIMERFEPVLLERSPNAVVVVGDVNSTLACALVASKVSYAGGTRPQVVHVEAGLRSFDRSMPEEVNRTLTDALSDILFTTEESGNSNLRREGVPASRIAFVGNVMIDSLNRVSARAEGRQPWAGLGLERNAYGVVTLHRPGNVDNPLVLRRLISAFNDASKVLPLVFPLHPRTRAAMQAAGITADAWMPGLTPLPPLPYVEFIGLVAGAAVVMTDSGGLQEETTVLNVPCLTLRDATERPVTVSHGTSRLVGTSRDDIMAGVADALAGRMRRRSLPPLWDGAAAGRAADVLCAALNGR
jgi:UDP-N-acetylglucosamine 2-epimerase (non-hydrolysing)